MNLDSKNFEQLTKDFLWEMYEQGIETLEQLFTNITDDERDNLVLAICSKKFKEHYKYLEILKQRRIDFYAGYHEWVLEIDNEIVYSFGDLGDTFVSVIDTKDKVMTEVEDLVYVMKEQLKEEGNELRLTELEEKELVRVMTEELYNFYVA